MPDAKNKGLNLEKFRALAGFAPSLPVQPLPAGPPPLAAPPVVELEPFATIEMSWAEVAVRLAVASLQIHFSNNPKHQETIDEFLVRGELRAILVSMLSSGFVTFKETAYEEGVKNSQRLDVLLRSSRENGKQLAWVELKSDSAGPDALEADWVKLHDANTNERRISIFSGILTKKRFDEFERLYKSVEDLQHEHKFVATVNRQFINFESLRKVQSDQSADSFERLYSVAYVYAIDTPNPNIAFNIVEKPEKASSRRAD